MLTPPMAAYSGFAVPTSRLVSETLTTDLLSRSKMTLTIVTQTNFSCLAHVLILAATYLLIQSI